MNISRDRNNIYICIFEPNGNSEVQSTIIEMKDSLRLNNRFELEPERLSKIDDNL